MSIIHWKTVLPELKFLVAKSFGKKNDNYSAKQRDLCCKRTIEIHSRNSGDRIILVTQLASNNFLPSKKCYVIKIFWSGAQHYISIMVLHIYSSVRKVLFHSRKSSEKWVAWLFFLTFNLWEIVWSLTVQNELTVWECSDSGWPSFAEAIIS